jgi:guanine deaminase
MSDVVVRGQVLAFDGDPFRRGSEAATRFFSDGAVAVRDGIITAVGEAREVIAGTPAGSDLHHYPDHLVMAGFVDAHVHYPQTEVIASFGEQLIAWLEKYTFPAERKFGDSDYARTAARLFLAESLRNGVTTSAVFCTVHPQSVDAFFEECLPYGLRMIAGKVMMDRNAPEDLRDSAETAYADSKALLQRWHGNGRLCYALTPRFAPTSTPAQLDAAGALWREYPDCFVQTHVSENRQEIAWVRELFPDAADYLDVYERAGLIGPRAVLGHGIHLSDSEKARLKEKGAAIAHCPTSNMFIGSGLFDLEGSQAGAEAMRVGLASDIGGGTSFSMFATMRTAYEIAQLRGYALHPANAFYLATQGSAKALYLDDKIGNVAPGYEADLVVIDMASTPLIAERMRHATDLAEALFIQMILADDRAIRATYAAGRKVYERGQELVA